MKKRILALALVGLLVVPMTGCNTSIKILGTEIVNVDDKQDEQQETNEHKPPQETTDYTVEEVLSILLTGNYTLTVNGTPFVYRTEDMLLALYDGDFDYVVDKHQENQYLVQIRDTKSSDFVTFLVHTDTLAIEIIEITYNGQFNNTNAGQVLAQAVYNECFNPEDGTLTKKQQPTKEEQKDNTSKEQTKKESKNSKQEKKETPKTCQWCHTNQLPSGSSTNDKCSECKQESWNFDCNDCGKSMSIDEYWSYGHDTGFCPSCYDKYIKSQYQSENTDTDHKCYYCDRCGRDITYKNFVQNFTEGGYNYSYICEACLLELGY